MPSAPARHPRSPHFLRALSDYGLVRSLLKTKMRVNTMSPTIRNQAKLASLAAAAVLAFTAFGPGEARAQSNNVKDFSCTTDPFGVHVDVSGVGNTNLCVDGSVTLDLSCACVGGGDNCPSDAKKQTIPVSSQAGQSVEPKNGRVNTTFTLPISISDGLCTAPQCGGGQDTKLIKWDTFPPEGSPATFRVCTTDAPGGRPAAAMARPF
jgi:hypothetical protein